ncbi:RNA-binding cell elongation regulator Jag/EloR [Bacillaceae bacterium S4-13-58]
MKQVTATGLTINEAVQSALEQLNTTEDQVKVEVIEEGKKGIFGVFGSKRAVVKVKIQENTIQDGENYLKKVAQEMGAPIEVKTKKQDREVTFELVGEKIALLIGKRGQTLNALQYLTHLVVNHHSDDYKTVIIDAEGYRDRRNSTLIQLAERLAEKSSKTHKEVKLEPMPSYERKIIHTVLQDRKDVSTYSDGSEPNRFVVIKPNK